MFSSLLKRIATEVKKSQGRKLHEYEIDLSCSLASDNIAEKPLELSSGRMFPELYITGRRETIIGINREEKELVKIELCENPRKALNIKEEFKFVQRLNEMGAASCPAGIESGEIELTVLGRVVDEECLERAVNARHLNYMVQEFTEAGKRMRVADLIFAVLEQKNLGVYQGDLKPSNIVFDEDKGIAILVDYDQAEVLDDSVMQLSALAFLKWCDEAEMRKYGYSSWLRHFPGIEFDRDIMPPFRDGAFDLSQTTLYRRQVTTNTPDGVYHTINERDVFADGIRDLEDRKHILDSIDFERGEEVLDIGCNAGLLCHYLHDRGCDVTGIEMDSSLTLAAGIIARITRRNINFVCLDIDEDQIPGSYDTAMLFSLLHHTRNVEKNARKIASICRRIIIECRLNESGSKPNGKDWRKATHWAYENTESLIQWLESVFPGFAIKKNYGIGGRDRFILEFVKNRE